MNVRDLKLRFEVDVAEPRVYLGRLVAGLDGTSVKMSYSTDMWQDPVTGTMMLKPLSLTSAWSNTFTGTGYVRTALSGFSFITPGNFKQVQIRGTGDFFIRQYKGSEERFTTTTSYAQNSCFNISFFNSGIDTNSDDVFLKVDFNYNVLGNTIVQLFFYGNGKIELYKNGRITGILDRSTNNFSPGNQLFYTQALANKFCDILIIPYRNRDLLIHTNFGTSGVFSFEDLDPTSTTNAILPAGQVSFRFPQAKGSVQFSQCHFKTIGSVIGSPVKFRYTPPASYTSLTVQSRTISNPFGPAATITLTPTLVEDSATPGTFVNFVPNGVKNVAYCKIAVTSSNSLSNVALACGDAWYDPTPTTTNASPIDITTALEECHISISEDGKGSGSILCRRQKLLDLGVAQPGITGDRPFRMNFYNTATPPQSLDLMRGTMSAPVITYTEADNKYKISTLAYDLRDRSYDFEISQLTDSIPLDGMTFTQAIENLLLTIGYTSADFYVSPNSFVIPVNPDVASGTYNLTPSREDTIAAILDRMKRDYAATWYTGWRPDYLSGNTYYYWTDLDNAPTTPVITLYQSVQSAISLTVPLTQPNAQNQVIYSLKKQYEAPEANHVFVCGVDYRTGNLIYSFYNDTASQTPNTAPASRPKNWVGRTKAAVLIDPSITTQAAADYAKTILSNRLSRGRTLIEFDSELLQYTNGSNMDFVWIGDYVRIMMPNGTDVYGEFQIIAIPDITIRQEATGLAIKKCTYRAEMKASNPAWYAEGTVA